MKVKVNKDLKRKLQMINVWKRFKKNMIEQEQRHSPSSVISAFIHKDTREGIRFWNMVAKEIDRLE